MNKTSSRNSPTPLQLFESDADTDLIERMASGDATALGVLYDRHGPPTYAMILRMVGIPEDAEELTADVFAQIWRSARGFDASRGSIGAWIVTVARSRALDHLRSRKRGARAVERAVELSADVVSMAGSASAPSDAQAERSELGAIVSRALNSLPDPQRRVIELAYYDGLSQSEIAERLSEPLGTVKTRMRTAMLRLRDSLTPLVGMEAT